MTCETPLFQQSGPTYLTLVRHFWVRAKLYDQKAAKLEMDEKVMIDPSLEGKTREEMGLEPFRGEEIRSSVLGIPVVISVDTDLKESSIISNLMDDFPPICKQDPLEVRVMFIKDYYEMTGHIIKISDIPDDLVCRLEESHP